MRLVADDFPFAEGAEGGVTGRRLLVGFLILSNDDGRRRLGNGGQVARGLCLGCQTYCGCNGQAKGRDAKCGESVPEPPRPTLGSGPALASGYPWRSVCCSPDSSLIPHLSAPPRDRAVTRSRIQEEEGGCLDGAPTACLISFRLVTGPPKQARQLEKDNKQVTEPQWPGQILSGLSVMSC